MIVLSSVKLIFGKLDSQKPIGRVFRNESQMFYYTSCLVDPGSKIVSIFQGEKPDDYVEMWTYASCPVRFPDYYKDCEWSQYLNPDMYELGLDGCHSGYQSDNLKALEKCISRQEAQRLIEFNVFRESSAQQLLKEYDAWFAKQDEYSLGDD